RIGAVLAVAARRAVDEARVPRAEVLEADPEARRDAGAVALEEHVGGRGEAEKRVASRRRLEVDVEALEAAAGAVAVERRADLHRPLLRRRTDLDDARAVVGEDARGARRRADARQVEDGDPVEQGS